MPPIITKLPIVINKIQYHYSSWLDVLLLVLLELLEVLLLSVLLELFGIIYGLKVI